MRNSSWFGLLLTALAACGSAEQDGVSAGEPGLGGLGGTTGGGGAFPDAGTGTGTMMNPVLTPGSPGGNTIVYSDAGAGVNPDKCVTTKAAAPPASIPISWPSAWCSRSR